MPIMAKKEDTTQTVRVSHKTARLLNTLASWNLESIGDFCDANLNWFLEEMVVKMAESLGKSTPATRPKPEK